MIAPRQPEGGDIARRLVASEDWAEYVALPDECRDTVRLRLRCMERIEAASNVALACSDIAADMKTAGRKGFSASRLRSLFYAWKAGGDWRIFIDRAKAGTTTTRLPREFIDFWRALCDQNQRAILPAWRKLVRMWREGEEIPGFGNWREWYLAEFPLDTLPERCPDKLPAGWSKRNLDKYKPTEAERAATRLGIQALRKHVPRVLMTREGLRPLELVAFDDVKLDSLVIVDGVDKPCLLMALVAIDVATMMPLSFVLRPVIPRADGKRDNLKLSDMRRLVAQILRRHGHPVGYESHYLVENATAAIPEDDERALREVTGGSVVVNRTSMISGQVMLGGYADKASGNAAGKVWIEQFFNWLHNQRAELPGQTGPRYDKGPAELATRIDAARKLIRAGQHLPIEERNLLRLPFERLEDAAVGLEDLFRRYATRHDHRHECFETVTQWRADKALPWQPFEALAELAPGAAESVTYRKTLESSIERWVRLVADVEIRKLPDEALHLVLREHRSAVVTAGVVRLRVGKKPRVFDADAAGLANGTELLAYFNEDEPDILPVTDGRGRLLAALRAVKAVRRDDRDALAAAIEKTQKAVNRVTGEIQRRGKAAGEQALEDAEHNLDILTRNMDAVDIAPVDEDGRVARATGVVADVTAVDGRIAKERQRQARRRERAAEASGDLADLLPEDGKGSGVGDLY